MAMKKKISMIVVIILVLQILLPTVHGMFETRNLATTEGTRDTEKYINTSQDLWDFASEVNNGNTFEGITVYLTSDIKLECSEENQWVPMSKFYGEFNGQGHTISGLYIKSEEELLGLFNENQGKIENLNISNSYIEATNTEKSSYINVGFIASKNYYGIIENCRVSDSEIKTITTSRIYVGGICGYNSSSATIEYCENGANIYTKNIAATGGIVGENYGMVKKSTNMGVISGEGFTNYNSCGIGGIIGSNHSKVNLCTNYGNIKSNVTTGGVVGTNFDGDTETIACCNLGNVEGRYCGGIVGRNGSSSNVYTKGGVIINSYNVGELIPSHSGGTICYSNKENGRIQNCYYLESQLEGIVYNYAENTEITEKTKLEMQEETFVQLLNKEGKQYEYMSNNYPYIDIDSPNIEVEYSEIENNSIIVTLKSKEELREIQGWTRTENKNVLTKKFYINQKQEIIIEDYNYNQTAVTIKIDTLADSVISGENYYINTFEDLQVFAQEVNNGNNCKDKNIYLMSDIDIEEKYIWDVIGKAEETAFKGNFNGNNHKINGINIDEYAYYKGFFGYIEDAKVKGLEVSGEINGQSINTGGIAGYNKRSFIEDCINNININEKNNVYDNNFNDTWGAKVGGIVGSADSAKIIGCTNNGEIIYGSKEMGSSGSVGGITGYLQQYSTILYCSNNANITSTKAYYVGGISGYTYMYSQIQNSYNKGKIVSNSIPQGLGGITGEVNAGTLINNYNLGEVGFEGTGTTNGTGTIYKIGGIVGETYNKIILENCYSAGNAYTAGIAGMINSTSGIIENNYYLNSSATCGYYSSKIEEIEIIEKSDKEMKNEAFVELLNSDTKAWRQDINHINEQYPYIAKLSNLSISNEPSKKEYKEGEKFNSAGMQVIATYDDGSSRAVENYIVTDGESLDIDQTNITISYTEEGITKTTTQLIVVKHDMQEATCIEPAKCKAKGCTYTEGEPLGHNHEAQVTGPTCLEKGYTTHTCTRCNDTYVDTYTDALGHSFTNYVPNDDATCTENRTTTAKCERCDETDTKEIEESKIPHNYENGTCTGCGEKEPTLEITTETYNVQDSYITKIQVNTTVKELKENIQTNATEVNVYNKEQELQKEESALGTGMTVEFKFNNKTYTYTIVVSGDTDGDGKVKFKDMSMVNKHRLNKTKLEGAYLLAADVTGDGEVNFKDLVRINKFRLKKITEL